jgi:hypothetical protein
VGGAPGPRTALVGTASVIGVFAEDFEAGIPVEWTVTGPWVATGSCAGGGGCTGDVWAYCGDANVCTYGTGGAVSGGLTTPPIELPTIGAGERLTLVFCTAMSNENASRYDRGMVRIAGIELDETPHSDGAWMVREVDLSGYAGQTVEIQFFFATLDSFANAFTGWLIDSVAVERTSFSCVDPCPGDINGSGAVNAADFTILAGNFGLGTNATLDDGDVNGDGLVNAQDFVILAGAFGSSCD